MIGSQDVYEAAFAVIQKSREWSYDAEPKEYASFVNGVVTLAGKLLDQIRITEQNKEAIWKK